MAGNSNLHMSRDAKEDEYYTDITLIEDELKNYCRNAISAHQGLWCFARRVISIWNCKMIIAFCKQPHSAKEIMDYIKINDRSFFRRHYLNPMIKIGQLKMTIPDMPKSRNQKYYA